jgi:hypothetical protein
MLERVEFVGAPRPAAGSRRQTLGGAFFFRPLLAGLAGFQYPPMRTIFGARIMGSSMSPRSTAARPLYLTRCSRSASGALAEMAQCWYARSRASGLSSPCGPKRYNPAAL